ncbi:MAG TPA: zinc ABC transporter substrate-binding protein [Acidimicrobiales bacterium]|nr:zinc ABC transporter substrate-binding protein [Acidimicrobiales bacterium]
MVIGIVLVLSTAGLSACASGPPGASTASGGRISVVAAENFWGSIARQLGGDRVSVTSIISNPDADPHSYEPTPGDGRTVATAQLMILDGIGYDPWTQQLLAANPTSGRTVLNVGDLVHVPVGGNPHRWYDPTNVRQVIAQITADYRAIDPKDAAYFDHRRQVYEDVTLAPYNALISSIRSKYAGTPIGASESIVSPLAQALGLDMLTPASFLDAISEGSDPTAADKATIDQQISKRQIAIYVYNSQNATPDVAAQVAEAKANDIPVATVTETLAPANQTFQAWQVRELQGIQSALAKATGR